MSLTYPCQPAPAGGGSAADAAPREVARRPEDLLPRPAGPRRPGAEIRDHGGGQAHGHDGEAHERPPRAPRDRLDGGEDEDDRRERRPVHDQGPGQRRAAGTTVHAYSPTRWKPSTRCRATRPPL